MLYLIRHGLTWANKENRFAGRSSEALCPEGISRLEELSKELRQIGLEYIFSGPLPRTVQSAEVISRFCEVDVKICPELNEIYLPHWDRLTKAEIRSQYGRQYPTWLEDPAGFKVPGCETLADVQQRAVALAEQAITDFPGKNILLVTHLIVGRCLVLYERGLGLDKFRTIKIANGRLVSLPGISAG